MSYKAEVEVVGEQGTWHSNALRFATRQEAHEYGSDLMGRWMATTAMRVVESTDDVNYVWDVREGARSLASLSLG